MTIVSGSCFVRTYEHFPGSVEEDAEAGPKRAGIDPRDFQPQLAPLPKRHFSRQPGTDSDDNRELF